MNYADTIVDLEANNASKIFACYGDPIFEPNDILLQVAGFPFYALSYSITVNVCDVFGNFLETSTDYFDWFFAYSTINGQNYYYCTFRCNNFSPAMLARKCFTLGVIINQIDTPITVFNKFTQKYELQESATVFPSDVTITIGDSGDIATLCEKPVPKAACDKPILRFIAYSECIDSLTGYYYGDASAFIRGNIDANAMFPYANVSYIYARRNRVPKEIKRTVSFNCRTQISQTIQKWNIEGTIAFPDWKVDDLESYLFCDKLFINDVLYQSEGGAIFTELLKDVSPECIKHYLLLLPIQECIVFHVYGCTPECSNTDTYYPVVQAGAQYYNEQRRLIATTPQELVTYFKSINGVTAVYLPSLPLDCPMDLIVQVQGKANIDSFIYVDNIYQSQRVYQLRADRRLQDVNVLCRGVSNESVIPIPVIGEIDEVSVVIPDPVIGEMETLPIKNQALLILDENSWVSDPTYTKGFISGQDVTLSIVTSNPLPNSTTGKTLLVNELIAQIEPIGAPLSTIFIKMPNMPDTSALSIDTGGNIYFTGYPNTEDGSGSTIELYGISYKI